jgi:hypothetical protein
VGRELVGRVSPPSIERLKEAWEEARQTEFSHVYRAKLEIRRRQAAVHDLEYRYSRFRPVGVSRLLVRPVESGDRATSADGSEIAGYVDIGR